MKETVPVKCQPPVLCGCTGPAWDYLGLRPGALPSPKIKTAKSSALAERVLPESAPT